YEHLAMGGKGWGGSRSPPLPLFWTAMRGTSGALRTVARCPGDAVPDLRCAQIPLVRPGASDLARDVPQFRPSLCLRGGDAGRIRRVDARAVEGRLVQQLHPRHT